MFAWWKTLSYFEQFYVTVAAVSICLLVILTALVILGADKTTQRIESPDEGAIRSIKLFSFPTLNGFLLGLGWGGILCMNIGLNLITVVILSICLGFILMALLYFLLVSLSGLHASRRIDLNHAIGEIAEVYSTIPANRKGKGRIRVKIRGNPMTFDAESNSPSSLKPGDRARVAERIAKAVFLVKEK